MKMLKLYSIPENSVVRLPGDPAWKRYVVRLSLECYMKGSSLPTTLTCTRGTVILWPYGQWRLQASDGQGKFGQPIVVCDNKEVELL